MLGMTLQSPDGSRQYRLALLPGNGAAVMRLDADGNPAPDAPVVRIVDAFASQRILDIIAEAHEITNTHGEPFADGDSVGYRIEPSQHTDRLHQLVDELVTLCVPDEHA